MAFDKDLEEAKVYEEAVSNYINKTTPLHTDVVEGYCKEWDLIALDDDNEWTFEVKHDVESRDMGNVAIEIRCSGKPSGVSTTKAKWWVHIYYLNGVEYLRIVRSALLRNYIKEYVKTHDCIKQNVGDGADIVLINKDDFATLHSQRFEKFNYRNYLDL